MGLLASLYCPNMNPVGPPSVLAALFFAWHVLLIRRARGRRRAVLLGWAPFVWAALALISANSQGRFPDADDKAAWIIAIAAGFGLGLAQFRGPSWVHRVIGVLATYSFGMLVVLVAWGLTHWRFAAPNLVMVVAVVGFVLLWTPVLVMLWRWSARQARGAQGRCDQCGYDLRGSVEFGRCPECGTPILRPDAVPPIRTSHTMDDL